MPNRRKHRISDDDIAELFRRSLFNPDRIIMRFWEGIDYVVTSHRFASCLPDNRLLCGPHHRVGSLMAGERRISFTNTGNARISVILNGCLTFDLLPEGQADAPLRQLTCIVFNDRAVAARARSQ